MAVPGNDISEQVRDDAFNKLGRLLITEVRDRQIRTWDQAVEGVPSDRNRRILRDRIQQLQDPKAVELISLMIPWIIDDVIAHVLGAIEDQRDIDIMVSVDEYALNVSRLSDGLEGELYGKHGWLAKFSSERQTSMP